MPLVNPFRLDIFVREHKPKSKISLHDSCVSPLSLGALAGFADSANNGTQELLDKDLAITYGAIRGSPRLRTNIANLYGSDCCDAEDVVVTSGAISANFLILDTLLKQGDHVVVQYPTYGQLFEIPKRSGANVSLWRMQEDECWDLDINELKRLVRPGQTKMIILNNPSNPCGTQLSTNLLQDIVKVAAESDILILCDEVFRPLFHDSEPHPLSALSLGYDKVLVTGSMSKAYALPGIRLGWIAAHRSLRSTTLQRLIEARDYTSISVSQLDDQIAAYALEPLVRERILKRSLALPQENIKALQKFVEQFKKNVSWVKPAAAGTCAIKVMYDDGQPVDDKAFSEALVREKGLLIPPVGYCFGTEAEGDLKGYLRVGIVIEPEILRKGLAILADFLPGYVSDAPVKSKIDF